MRRTKLAQNDWRDVVAMHSQLQHFLVIIIIFIIIIVIIRIKVKVNVIN